MVFRSVCIALLVIAAAARAEPVYVPHAYRELGPFTDRDTETLKQLDLSETDLGVSFPMRGADGKSELIFLFGDTHPWSTGPNEGRWDEDVIASAPLEWTDRRRLPALKWLTRPDGQFLSLLVPGEDLRAMDVPLDGVQVGSRVLLFFNAGFTPQRRRHEVLICAEAKDGKFHQLERRFRQPTDKFLNVSVSPDPTDAGTIWIFGTGPYRRSPIYLARARAETLDDFSTWEFRAGDAWVSDESRAEHIVRGRIGELSARYVPAAKSWVLMYQRRLSGSRTQGVYVRFAPQPTGPWSDELPLLEPDAKNNVAFSQFIHRARSDAGFCDGLAGSDREELTGDPYGPYLVPEWCYVDADGRLHLVHTLSTWNPYRVSLMDAVLAPPGAALAGAATRPATATPPRAADDAPLAAPLTAQGSPLTKRSDDGREWLSLLEGSAELSTTWTVTPGQRWLAFELRGKGIVAQLRDESGHLIRQSRGPGEEESSPLKVRWRLEDLEGQRVALMIIARAKPGLPPVELTTPVLRAQP